MKWYEMGVTAKVAVNHVNSVLFVLIYLETVDEISCPGGTFSINVVEQRNFESYSNAPLKSSKQTTISWA